MAKKKVGLEGPRTALLQAETGTHSKPGEHGAFAVIFISSHIRAVSTKEGKVQRELGSGSWAQAEYKRGEKIHSLCRTSLLFASSG